MLGFLTYDEEYLKITKKFPLSLKFIDQLKKVPETTRD